MSKKGCGKSGWRGRKNTSKTERGEPCNSRGSVNLGDCIGGATSAV